MPTGRIRCRVGRSAWKPSRLNRAEKLSEEVVVLEKGEDAEVQHDIGGSHKPTPALMPLEMLDSQTTGEAGCGGQGDES